MTHAEARKDLPAYFPAYEQLSEALLEDDFAAAQKAAKELATQARDNDLAGIAEAADRVAESSDLNAARKHLTALNAQVVPRLRGKGAFTS